MIKNLDVFDVVRMNDFVREPVDSICDNIENTYLRKIILNGGRGVGKSIVLANSELKGIGHKKQTIYTQFDAIGICLGSSQNVDESIYIHYYELLLSKKMLNYIKKYYEFTYQNKFMDYHDMVNKYLNEFYNYINNFMYDDSIKISRFLKQGEISSEIRERMFIYLQAHNLTLAIDRFDWTNSNSKLSQEILSGYFEMLDKFGENGMFDKIVITSDDDTLDDEDKIGMLRNKHYDFITIDYGKNIDIVREIIRKRVESYNKTIALKANQIPFSDITDEILNELIIKTNGNIKMMLKCLDETNYSFKWDIKGFDMEQEFSLALEEQLKNEKHLTKTRQSPKLYL